MNQGTTNPLPRTLFLRRFEPCGMSSRQPFAWLRARAVGLLIRCALLAGFRVVVVGSCRAGKTYLLERTFAASKLIDGAEVARTGAGPTPFNLAKLPQGMFAIEEPQAFNQTDLIAAVEGLRARTFVMSLQAISMVGTLGLERLFSGRRTLVLHLGPVMKSARAELSTWRP